MKFVTLAGDRQFQVHDEPMFPVNGSPIVKVTHCGMCATDYDWWHMGSSHLGQVLGHEFSGIIEDSGHSPFHKGDRVAGYTQNVYNEPCGHCAACLKGEFDQCTNRRVYTWKGGDISHPGSYSEYTTWFPQSLCVLPDGVSQEAGALIEPFSVGLHAVLRTGIKPGDKCLILGCGMIASTIAEWLKVFGAEEITMTEINPVKIEFAQKFGIANHVVRADDPNLAEMLQSISKGGYDACFACVAAPGAVQDALYALKDQYYMKFVPVAYSNKPLPIDYDRIINKQIQVLGSKGHHFNEFQYVIRAIENGSLNPLKYVTMRIPFADIQRGFERYESDGGNQLKALIEF